jgi:hypothetical protein
VRFCFEDAWSARELIELRRELIRAGELTAQSAVLFDLRRAAGIPDLAELSHHVDATPADAIRPACRAFVVSTEAQYHGARQLQTLLGAQSVVNEIFQEESSAIEWLAAMSGRTRTTTPA